MLAKRKIINYKSTVRVRVVKSYTEAEPHWHDDVELIALKRGKAVITADNEKYEAVAGDAFFIGSRQPHGIVSTSADAEFVHVLFDESTADIAHGRQLKQAKLTFNYNINKLASEIERELESKEAYFEQAIINLVSGLMIDILRREPYEERDSVREEATFGKLLKKIDTSYEFFSFEDAAAYMNLSPVYFSTMFHKFVGVPFSKYINGVRIEKAVELLKRPGSKITEVAMSCGFDTIRNFNYVFRKYTGFAPKQMPSDFRYENRYIACADTDASEVVPPPKMR